MGGGGGHLDRLRGHPDVVPAVALWLTCCHVDCVPEANLEIPERGGKRNYVEIDLPSPPPDMSSIRQIYISDVYLSRQNVFEIRKALKLN